jgi:alkanesulfonate monooxygenase SsuD/methylene tetrahydromethanopterin reductase-like flavin-dependent oxidoreductase (luciferase family)
MEMRAMLAAAAALTERVRIVPSLYVLPMHSAVWAAKEIATLDVISNGRVTVTVGVGGRPGDYAAVDANFKNRHARMDQQIASMKAIWAGQPPGEGLNPVGPTPVQTGGPPILVGAMGPKAIRRAAEWADGIYAFSMNGEYEEIQRMFDMANAAWKEAGRSDKPYLAGGFWYCLADDAERRMREYAYNYLAVAGPEIAQAVADSMSRFTPAAVSEALDNLRRAGCEECYLVPATDDLAEVERVIPLL